MFCAFSESYRHLLATITTPQCMVFTSYPSFTFLSTNQLRLRTSRERLRTSLLALCTSLLTLRTSLLALLTSRLALRTSQLNHYVNQSALHTSQSMLRTSQLRIRTSQFRIRTSQLRIRYQLERIRKLNLDFSLVQTLQGPLVNQAYSTTTMHYHLQCCLSLPSDLAISGGIVSVQYAIVRTCA